MNSGQLALLIRSKLPGRRREAFNKVQGLPFYSDELADRIDEILGGQ